MIVSHKVSLVDVSLLFEKSETENEEIYTPVSILYHMSGVSEKILLNQIYDFINSKFSPLLCGFIEK